MTETPALAEWLRGLSDDALGRILRRRKIPFASVRDFFDLADALVAPDSVDAALAHLHRRDLETVAADPTDPPSPDASAALARLAASGLAAGDPPAVLTVTRTRLAQLTANKQIALSEESAKQESAKQESAKQESTTPQSTKPTSTGDSGPIDATALSRATTPPTAPDPVVVGERAFHAVAAIDALLTELRTEPAQDTARGAIAQPSLRRLGESFHVEPSEIALRIRISEAAGLVAHQSGELLVTPDGVDWAEQPTVDRWLRIANGWRDTLAPELDSIRDWLAEHPWDSSLDAFAGAEFPLAGDEFAGQIAESTEAAAFLGILVDGAPSALGASLLASDTPGSSSAAGAATTSVLLAAALPAEVSQVYIQDDLSVISPGPLPPSVDARLRRAAELESSGLASTFRVTASSVDRALTLGETEQTLRQFLLEISLTGVPQPLDYLLTQSARRHGLVRVSGSDDHGTTVSSPDRRILDEILADQRLASLSLRPSPDGTLHTLRPALATLRMLVSARYPAARQDARGALIPPEPERIAADPSTGETDDPGAQLLHRLRTGSDAEPGHAHDAWLARRLAEFVRSRALVRVQMELPDGREFQFTLELTGVGGGRLRGRDRTADVERTLPLSSIRDVSPI